MRYSWSVAKPKGTPERIARILTKLRSQVPERFARSPMPYSKDFDRTLDIFLVAVGDAVRGHQTTARAVANTLNHEAIVTWFDETAQHVGSERVKLFGGTPVRRGGGGKRDMRITRVRKIAQRDGYRCGYCDVRLIEPEVLRKIDVLLGGGVLHKRSTPRNNRSYHGIWILTAVTLDHIEPLAIRHDDSDENLVACCWACNFGKYHFTLDELSLEPPKTGRGTSTMWSGLRELLG